MRVRSVTAHAFGPLRGQTLELAEGMTVVVGDNESAKSSWHAAIHAAVCGRRRGRGTPRADEQRFADRHRPWDGDGWLVSVRLDLDDGRHVELRQDLAGGVDCAALDLGLGQDVSAEIMHDRCPDGSRWLGLDRASFLATACISQTQLLAVREQAAGLQEHLQRAAATSGAAATAAAALDLVEQFARERVGTERSTSGRPLRAARLAHERAEQFLADARAAHEDYLARVADRDRLAERAGSAQERVHAAEAGVAAQQADLLERRAAQAMALQAAGAQPPPASASAEEALARRVTEALAAWRAQPAPPERPDPSGDQLQRELDGLPDPPDGDLEPAPAVQRAADRVERAAMSLDLHERSRPAGAGCGPAAVAAEDAELLDLARALESVPAPAPDSAAGAGTPPAGLTAGRVSAGRLSAAGAAVAGVAGLALALAGRPAMGAALLGLCLAWAAAAWVAGRRGRPSPGGSATADARAAHAPGLVAPRSRELTEPHRLAVQRCAQLGLPPDPGQLRQIPVRRLHDRAARAEADGWTWRRDAAAAELAAAGAQLAAALGERGVRVDDAPPPGLAAALAGYRSACVERAVRAREAGRRDGLARRLAATRAAEARAAHDDTARVAAARAVLAAARACDGTGAAGTAPAGAGSDSPWPRVDPRDAAVTLERWLAARTARLEQASAGYRRWADLQSVLAGRSPAELADAAAAARRDADTAARRVGPQASSAVDPRTVEASLPGLRAAESAARADLAMAAGGLRSRAATLPGVAEAEEAVASTSAELHRVLELRETLELTRRFLQAAQARAHRDIAPRLAATVRPWLPRLTGGRYEDVLVDPTSLQVQVCGPSRRWQAAARLSHGTAEQVYLLLRVALADHLTHGYGTCPLLLDDVTVHADATRTREMLGLLLELAATRQVVVFSQEQQVADWAAEHLHGRRHAVRRLLAVPVA